MQPMVNKYEVLWYMYTRTPVPGTRTSICILDTCKKNYKVDFRMYQYQVCLKDFMCLTGSICKMLLILESKTNIRVCVCMCKLLHVLPVSLITS